MTSAQQRATLTGANCEIAFDNLTRQLYSTDASIYQIEPIGVAFPRTVRQAAAVIGAAGQAGIPLIPRGAGTGLVGGAIGEGLVIDFARYNRQITDLDLERRTVRVGPGVVLDQLNNFLMQHPNIKLVGSHMNTLILPAERNSKQGPEAVESSIIIFSTLFYE